MVTNIGNTLSGSHSAGSITPRLATDITYRQAHPEPKPKPKGLDWDRLGPTCPGCSQPSRLIDHTGVCPDCRKDLPTEQTRPTRVTTSKDSAYQTLPDEDIQRRFTAPDVHEHTPHREKSGAVACSSCLEELEPAPVPAAPPRPAPSIRAKVRAVGPTDVAITLRSTTGQPLDQVKVAALLHDLLTALHQTPAPADPPSPAAGAGPMSEGPRPVGKRAGPSDTPGFEAFKRTRKPRAPRIDNFPLARATQLLNDGHSVPQIAAELGCAVSTARRHLKAAGAHIPDGRTTHSGGRNAKTTHDDNPALRDEIVRRYKAGESTVQLGRAHDRSAKQINAILRRAGVELRPQANVGRPITDADRHDITTSYTAGEPAVSIARRLGVKKDRVRDVLVDAGLDIRGPGRSAQRPLPATAHAIKTWALEQGLIDQIRTGRVPGHLIDAYETAHPTTEGRATA